MKGRVLCVHSLSRLLVVWTHSRKTIRTSSYSLALIDSLLREEYVFDRYFGYACAYQDASVIIILIMVGAWI